MELRDIHKKLDKQCPGDFIINEIILFAYPYRRLKINATVNKSPEKSIQQVYSILLRTIQSGYKEEAQLIHFLGLHKEDFVLRELYFLRERGYVDFISGEWLITESGEKFIEDNSILKILEEEEYEFLLDSITDEVVVKDFRLFSDSKNDNKIKPEKSLPHKSINLLDGKNEQLADVYKKQNRGKAYLIDFDKSNILFDKEEFNDYYLIEYIPRRSKGNNLEPYIEIRNSDNDISLNKRLTKNLSLKYPTILYDFTNSERASLAKIEEEELDGIVEFEQKEIRTNETKTLSIWETQAQFENALRTVKKRLLIESPWIKKATLNYISAFEKALKRDVTIVVLYGIEGNDEHYRKAEKEMERLDRDYESFHLVHLPTHFEECRNHQMTGTHRKLIIKDNDYYIQGSFNFLSFNKKEGQKVANEESIMIAKSIDNKWKQVFKEYDLNVELVKDRV